jgi:hypothetical protein
MLNIARILPSKKIQRRNHTVVFATMCGPWNTGFTVDNGNR